MTVRQRFLKLVYPLFLKMSKGKAFISRNRSGANSNSSFYQLKTKLINGEELDFEKLRGKKVLIVNSASDCGYTPQYSQLQDIYDEYKQKVEIIAFPANDFKEQEKGSEEEIMSFCKRNYGVNFPLAKKSIVLKNADQNPVFGWLTNKGLNGWNDREPAWNFTKYLINENGILTHVFGPSVSPDSDEVVKAIKS